VLLLFASEYIVLRSRTQRLRPYGIHRAYHAISLYPRKLLLTSPTSGGRSVGTVRSRIQATEFVCYSLFSARSSGKGVCIVVFSALLLLASEFVLQWMMNPTGGLSLKVLKTHELKLLPVEIVMEIFYYSALTIASSSHQETQ
jgi:hypothetical protein